MYEKPFRLEIVTPERVMFQGEASSLTAPGVMGSFQVLYNHAPLIAAIGVGELKVKDPGGADSYFATAGGFVEVNRNRVVVLAESAEQAGDIDVKRAREARDRAQQRLRERESVDIARAEAALARAMNRLRVAEKA
jgi:F-type H+-transporting ATPase subunit epsilon